MANYTPKQLHIRPWEPPSPLVSKRRRLDNATWDIFIPSIDAPSFSGCLRMTPDGSDEMADYFSQKLSPELEPYPQGFNGFFGAQYPLWDASSEGESPLTGLAPTERQSTPTSFPGGSTSLNPVAASAPFSITSLPLDGPSSLGMQASLAMLDADSQAARLARTNNEQNNKSTGKTYQRHIDRYEKWWVIYQADQTAKIPGRTSIPAFPITAAKVSMFLEYECSREKVATLFMLLARSLLIDRCVSHRKRQVVGPRLYKTPASGRNPSHRPFRPLRIGDSSTRTSTEMCLMRKSRCVPTTESRPSRPLRSTTSQSGLRAHRLSKRLAALQVTFSRI